MAFSHVPLAVFVLTVALASRARAEVSVARAQANQMTEITFTAARPHADPFNDLALDVTFTAPDGSRKLVPAFWAGKNIWKARYASPVQGEHTYRSESSDPADPGLHGVTGKVEITPYTGTNPLHIHGPLKIAPDQRHFQHSDGTPFFWLGDTWWMGLCHRLHWPDEFKTLAADRKGKGFNVVQLVAGLYPDMHPFDPRGANEAGFPWEADYARIRPEYFDAADQRIRYLVEEGFVPCVVGAWGYFLPWMGEKRVEQHWRYLIARWGALPVVWCAAGEANLPWYRAKGFPYDDREQVKGWTSVMRYIRATDPYRRPLTIHPTGLNRLSARHATDDAALLDFDFLQTPHGEREAVPATVGTVRTSYADEPTMPVIDGEAAYEMLNGRILAEWARRMFWLCMTNGAAGHTYGANGIWQVNRKGQPHGPSPTEGSPPTGYGTIAWDEAMRLPGSAQVGIGKRLFEQYRWWEFTPHPEWVSYADVSPINLGGCNWIWFPEGNAAQDAPAKKRYFRLEFAVPQGKKITSAWLQITADDRFAVTVNGSRVGASRNGNEAWRSVSRLPVAALLRPGQNVVAVEAENLPAPATNPAGLIARLQVEFADGQSMTLFSNGDWRCSKTPDAGWDTVGFEARGWSRVAEVAKYGEGPWGKLDAGPADGAFGPQSAGNDRVRVVYVPDPEPVLVKGLPAGVSYEAEFFDPVTGERRPMLKPSPDPAGNWMCTPPPEHAHDWVIIIEKG